MTRPCRESSYMLQGGAAATEGAATDGAARGEVCRARRSAGADCAGLQGVGNTAFGRLVTSSQRLLVMDPGGQGAVHAAVSRCMRAVAVRCELSQCTVASR